jgi:hypothetical protein
MGQGWKNHFNPVPFVKRVMLANLCILETDNKITETGNCTAAVAVQDLSRIFLVREKSPPVLSC